jgi:tetratricopeptide (TPR) repeat protein
MASRAAIFLVSAERFLSAAVFVLLLLQAIAVSQAAGSFGHPDEMRTALSTSPNTGIVTFKVFAERNGARLNQQAVVKLVNLRTQSATWYSTGDNSQGVFTEIPYGDYTAEISAVGYLSSPQDLKLTAIRSVQDFDVVLHRDPAAIKLDVADTLLSAKARKQAQHAVSALKSGNLKEAQKQLDEAYKSAPTSPDLNFLLGYLYFQKKDFSQAGTYLSTATNLNPHNAQALTLLGRAGLERQDYPAARSALEQAVLADGENWLPHNLLADAYLREKDYGKARDEAQVAISKGKTGASPAQLVLGQALVSLGHNQEGIQALNTFLQESPKHPLAVQVRTLIAELLAQPQDQPLAGPAAGPQGQDSAPARAENSLQDSLQANASQANARLSGVDPLLALESPSLSIKSWQPPGIDDLKLSLAPGVSCPSDKVIAESGSRVQEMVADVSRFAAVEDLFHQALDPNGNPVRTETRKFNYVASITESQPGFLSVDEFRADKLSLTGYPDNIASTGFISLALVFHPHMRDSFDMVCEGLGEWHGQASWLVHFRQRDDRPNHMHSYKVGNRYHPVRLKGRAWITADKFQIVRIEAEMVSPMPEIELLSEHQVVEYGPIPFAKKNTSLWLPKSAEIYFDFRRHRYYRRHSFDHYMLFSTDSDEKRKEPVAPPAPKQS